MSQPTSSTTTSSCMSWTSSSASSSLCNPQRRKRNLDGHAGTGPVLHAAGPFGVHQFLDLCFPGTDRTCLGSTFTGEFQTLWGEVDKACERKSEELMYPPMRTALQYACDVLADMKLPAFRVDYASQQRLTGEAPVGPGLALQLKDSSEMHWTRALVTVEAKPDVEQDPFKHDKAEPSSFITWNHFCESSALVLRARPRCYLLGLGAYGDTLRFWRCDQSSVMFTEAFEYMAQPELVLEFLYASSVFSGGTMGLDTTVAPGAYDVGDLEILASSCRFASASGILGKNMNLRAVDLLSESAVISVPMCDVDDRLSGNYSPGGDVQVVPNTAKSGASEEETVERYISVGPALFTSPSLFGRGTRTWLAVRASVLNSERGRVELADFVVIKETWRHADRLPESAIYAKVHAAGPVFGVARARRGVDLDKGEPQSTHLTWAERLNKFYGKEQYSLRIHQRIVIESIGIPLSQFRSSRELVEATRDAMKGHQYLFEKFQILHRDISVNNIMISADPQAEGGAKGFLIDLEYAAFLQDRRPTSTLREMTGEVCFMAIERQRGHYRGEHMVYHDLESFYWSLLYTTLRHTITNYAMRSCQSIFEQPDAIGKIAFLVQGQTELVVSHNPPLTACIQSFGLVAWESHHAHKYMTHASAIKTLDDELGKSGWPANDRARPFEPLETPFNEGIEESIHRLTGIVRATQEVYMKWKAGDADEDEQNEDVEGEPPARKRSRQQ